MWAPRPRRTCRRRPVGRPPCAPVRVWGTGWCVCVCACFSVPGSCCAAHPHAITCIGYGETFGHHTTPKVRNPKSKIRGGCSALSEGDHQQGRPDLGSWTAGSLHRRSRTLDLGSWILDLGVRSSTSIFAKLFADPSSWPSGRNLASGRPGRRIRSWKIRAPDSKDPPSQSPRVSGSESPTIFRRAKHTRILLL